MLVDMKLVIWTTTRNSRKLKIYIQKCLLREQNGKYLSNVTPIALQHFHYESCRSHHTIWGIFFCLEMSFCRRNGKWSEYRDFNLNRSTFIQHILQSDDSSPFVDREKVVLRDWIAEFQYCLMKVMNKVTLFRVSYQHFCLHRQPWFEWFCRQSSSKDRLELADENQSRISVAH